MKPKQIAKQVQIEQEMLSHIEQALRTALDWEVGGSDLSRNISTLRFVAESFRRHLDRAWALQEHGGYMQVVLELKPNLSGTVETMKRTHIRLQGELDGILLLLEQIGPAEREAFLALRGRLELFLGQLKTHDETEAELLMDAFLTEEGGPG